MGYNSVITLESLEPSCNLHESLYPYLFSLFRESLYQYQDLLINSLPLSKCTTGGRY